MDVFLLIKVKCFFFYGLLNYFLLLRLMLYVIE